MSEQTGSSLAAIAARQAALADQHSALAEADRELADALAGAHAALRDSIGRLDAIAAEIDDAMPAEGGADTPIAARELQRSLVAKQREIASVVEHAHALDHTKAVQLQRLREQYTTDPG